VATLTPGRADPGLSASDYAYVDSKGGKHLRIDDADHVHAAMGRFKSTHFEDAAAKSKAAHKLLAAAKRFGMDISDDNSLKSFSETARTGVAEVLIWAERLPHTHRLKGGGTATHVGIANPGHTHPAASDLGEEGALPYDPADDDNPADMAETDKVAEHLHLKKGGGKPLEHTDPPIADGHTHPGFLPFQKKDPNAKGKPFSETSCEMLAMAPMEFAEGKPLPFLTVGQRHFDDYGDFNVGFEDLKAIKELFDSGARGQDLPIINEAHDPNRAIGWIKSLEFDGDDLLVAIPEWNAAGLALKADEYRYTSPEILRGWLDPVSQVRHPLMPAGLALTNYPRLKDMGRLAASEDGSLLIACSERPLSVAAARHLAFADPDFDGDDDGPTGPCVNQPPFGYCPGYTRRPSDTDGDGTCLLAEQCNGYRQITASQRVQAMGNPTSPLTWAERIAASNSPPTPAPAPSTEEVPMAETTVTPPAPAADPSAALMAEHTALKDRFDASEKARIDLAEQVAQMKRKEVLTGVRADFADLIKTGRITPAERDALVKEDDAALKFAETGAPFLAILKGRPANSAVDLSIRGIGAPSVDGEGGGAGTAQSQLLGLAETIRTANPKLTKEGAYAEAVKQHPELFAEANTPDERRVEMAQFRAANPRAQEI
jgi:hypothetical protein